MQHQHQQSHQPAMQQFNMNAQSNQAPTSSMHPHQMGQMYQTQMGAQGHPNIQYHQGYPGHMPNFQGQMPQFSGQMQPVGNMQQMPMSFPGQQQVNIFCSCVQHTDVIICDLVLCTLDAVLSQR